MSTQRVVVLHGFMADPDQHWFPWLKNELATPRTHVEVPALPDSSAPDPNAWEAAAAEGLGDPDDDLVVVGHSLGCITALKALDARRDDWSLGGLVMVSGFDTDVPTLPELTAFTASTPDYSRLTTRVRARFAISSDNDEIVPPPFTETFAQHLDAALTTVPRGGHFLGSDGFRALPIAADLTRRALRA